MADPFARSLESDEMNSLLHNFLQSSFAHQPFSSHAPPLPIGPDDASQGFNYADPGLGFMADAKVYDIDEFDSDSKGAEASEGPSNPATRHSAKRTRAAEVHNMSEKRRRSRINEKMKALQKLIPNSNKTDKASMLDEAIEYLKQLQLQVQMLSMRNGVSLYPYCPPVLQPEIASEENQILTYKGDAFARNKEISSQLAFDTPNLLFPPIDIGDSKTTFNLETSVCDHFQTLDHSASSEDICHVSQLYLGTKNSSSGVSS